MREHVLRLGLRELDRELAGADGAASYGSVRRYERDERQAPADFLAGLLDLCHRRGHPLSGHWLLTGDGPPEVVAPGAAEDRLARIREIVLEEVTAAGKAELAQIAAAELLKKDRAEAEQQGAPPSVDKRHLPRRRRGS